MPEKQSIIVVGDYVARDKYTLGADADPEIPIGEIIDVVPRVPSRYVGPIPLLAVYQDLPTDAFVFRYPAEDHSVTSSIARPTQTDLESVIPNNTMAHELMTEVQDSVVLLGPSGSGKTSVLYRLAYDMLAKDIGEVLLLDGNGAFGARLSRMLEADARVSASGIAKLAGLHRKYGQSSRVVISTLLIDHIYLMNENLAVAAWQAANAIVDKYGPSRIIMTDLSALAARRRGIRFSAVEVELTSLKSDQIEKIREVYRPFRRVPMAENEVLPDASTPEEALGAPRTEEDFLEPLMTQIRQGLRSVARSSTALHHIPDLFYAALARHPAPITQAEMLDVLCDGDVFGGAGGAIPVAQRLVELGTFVTRADETKSLFISDLVFAKRVAAASGVSTAVGVSGALIDVAARRLNGSNDKDALIALRQIMSAVPRRAPTLGDLDDLQRRASLATAYLRAGRIVDRAVVSRLTRVSALLRKHSSNREISLRLRETLLRDAVELDSWIGNLDSEIEFHWVSPGVSKFRFPREQYDESYFISRGLYFASRPITEMQLWQIRKSLAIDSPLPPRRYLADPASLISWEDGRNLAVLLSSKIADQGYACDLPSIPEWALARSVLTEAHGEVGNVIGTPLCVGHRCPVDLYANAADPYFGGGILEWTRTSWGSDDLNNPGFGVPYDSMDGREDHGLDGMRMLRGGSWLFCENESFCSCVLPISARFPDVGVRFCLIPLSSSTSHAEKLRLSLAEGPRVEE
jgi:hypothetical protein